VARSGWSKQGGFEIYLDDSSQGLALWDALWDAGQDLNVGAGCPNLIERIEGGLFSYGSDMTIENNPFECGLDAYCELGRPTEFLARGALQRILEQGVERRMMGLRVQTDTLPSCLTRWPVTSDGLWVGDVTSAAVSPDFGCGVAFAMLERVVCTPGQTVTVETPEGAHEAVVSSIPFEHIEA
jgi:dimethylsulfoniopropionate demethylase